VAFVVPEEGETVRYIRSLGWAAALAAVLVALALPAAAGAGHSGYWFYQGYLPKADGTRTVLHSTYPCCDHTNFVRMSWTWGTHSMNFVFVGANGNWSFWESWSYDETVPVIVGPYGARSAGCQNPPRIGYYAVWTNCHIRPD